MEKTETTKSTLKLSAKQIKEQAEKMAGKKKDWITPQERKVYINGIIEGIIFSQVRFFK